MAFELRPGGNLLPPPRPRTNRLQRLLSFDLAMRKERRLAEAAAANQASSSRLDEAKFFKLGVEIEGKQLDSTKKKLELQRLIKKDEAEAREKSFYLAAIEELNLYDSIFHESAKTEDDLKLFGSQLRKTRNRYAGVPSVEKVIQEKLKNFGEMSAKFTKAKYAAEALAELQKGDKADFSNMLFKAQLGGVYDQVLKATGITDPDFQHKRDKMKFERDQAEYERDIKKNEATRLAEQQDAAAAEPQSKSAAPDNVAIRQQATRLFNSRERTRLKAVKEADARKEAMGIYVAAKKEHDANQAILNQARIATQDASLLSVEQMLDLPLRVRRALSSASGLRKTFAGAKTEVAKHPGLVEEIDRLESTGISLDPITFGEGKVIPEANLKIGQKLYSKLQQLSPEDLNVKYRNYLDNPGEQKKLQKLGITQADIEKLLK